MVRPPNFLILGAPRCSTTTLYHAARRHPEIYMSPVKEPQFFDLLGRDRPYLGPGDAQGIGDRGGYSALFADAGDEAVVGEASTHYLSSPRAPEAIRSLVPDARLLAVLRNPVDRALSHWAFHVWEGREPLEFADALAAEPERARAGWSPAWGYGALGLYGAQLERYLQLFSPDQLRVVLYDDLERDYAGELKGIWRFLEVRADVQDGLDVRWNSGGLPRSGLLSRVLRDDQQPLRRAARPVLRLVGRGVRERLFLRLERLSVQPPPAPPAELRSSLIEHFREDIARCEELIGRDLSRWVREPE